MKLHHKTFVTVDQSGWLRLEKLGIELEERRKTTGKLRLESKDDDLNWPSVKSIALEYGGEIFTVTSFSQEELDNAWHLEFLARESGYPQPEKDFRFLEKTYDPSSGCLQCGVGYKQVAPFRFRKPPKWGHYSAMTLNWVLDEIFIRSEAWETVFKPFGIGSRPVVLHSTGEVLADVVQIDVPVQVEFDLHPTEPYEDCKVCGQRRYDIHNIGFMPCPKDKPRTHLFKSSQWFGTGHNARQQLTITKELYEAIKASKLKGVYFRPCGPQIPQWKQPLRGAAAEP